MRPGRLGSVRACDALTSALSHFPLTDALDLFTISTAIGLFPGPAAVLFSKSEVFMRFSTRILLVFTLLLAAGRAAGDAVDHYELGTAAMRASGQSIYPAGVTDPALANPPGPPPDRAIPMPPSPGLPDPASTGLFQGTSPAGTTPAGSPAWPIDGPASSFNPSPGLPGVAGGAWSMPADMSPSVNSQAVVPRIVPPPPASWYTRVDYYRWNEKVGGVNYVNEDGALCTLGYSRQIGMERFRAELFGGDVHYVSYDPSGAADMASNTGYLGLRGEYEIVLTPAVFEGHVALMGGLGTRFWIRDLHDGSDAQGDQVFGYQETWWTIYPYLGLETHLPVGADMDWYSESRIGTTALTYQFATTGSVLSDGQGDLWFTQRPLWPKPGVFANLEIGLRGPRFFLAARAEVMSWAQSSMVQGAFQPDSVLFTAGGRFGFMF